MYSLLTQTRIPALSHDRVIPAPKTVTMMRRIRELMEDKEEAKQDKEAAELQLTSTQAGFTTRVKVLQEQRSRLARQVIALGSVPCCGFDAKGNDLEDVHSLFLCLPSTVCPQLTQRWQR